MKEHDAVAWSRHRARSQQLAGIIEDRLTHHIEVVNLPAATLQLGNVWGTRSATGRIPGAPLPRLTSDRARKLSTAGNPLHIAGLADLARPDVRPAMLNPAFEGVARQILASLVKASGEPLKTMVHEQKAKSGPATRTQIHRRRTPLFTMHGTAADADVTWQAEVAFQLQVGHLITGLTIPPKQNVTAIGASASAKGAAHSQPARDWLGFIRSRESLLTFTSNGFKPHVETAKTP